MVIAGYNDGLEGQGDANCGVSGSVGREGAENAPNEEPAFFWPQKA